MFGYASNIAGLSMVYFKKEDWAKAYAAMRSASAIFMAGRSEGRRRWHNEGKHRASGQLDLARNNFCVAGLLAEWQHDSLTVSALYRAISAARIAASRRRWR